VSNTNDTIPAGLLQWVKKRCRRGIDPKPGARTMIALLRARGFTDAQIAKFPQG
jgi:hypothetical protein